MPLMVISPAAGEAQRFMFAQIVEPSKSAVRRAPSLPQLEGGGMPGMGAGGSSSLVQESRNSGQRRRVISDARIYFGVLAGALYDQRKKRVAITLLPHQHGVVKGSHSS